MMEVTKITFELIFFNFLIFFLNHTCGGLLRLIFHLHADFHEVRQKRVTLLRCTFGLEGNHNPPSSPGGKATTTTTCEEEEEEEKNNNTLEAKVVLHIGRVCVSHVPR